MEHIVIDTNVVVSSLMSSRGASFRLMGMVDSGYFNFHLSTPLVLEYESVCKRLLGEKIKLTPDDIDDYVDYLCACGIEQSIYYLWRPYLADANDDMVLELAVKANCSWIVTFNVPDFRDIERFGIQAIKPLDFLKVIGVLP